jgi:2-succinyl-5-enolpyruvyl-6-hydroxy-3-cyclohexene-1-carboxylate synthase
LVVADNHGGGIFSFLVQRSAVDDARFERLFATPRSHDLAGIARAFGHEGLRVTTRSQLRDALESALDRPGLTVIVADVPSRDENVRRHDEWNESVKDVLGGRR